MHTTSMDSLSYKLLKKVCVMLSGDFRMSMQVFWLNGVQTITKIHCKLLPQLSIVTLTLAVLVPISGV